MSARAAAAQPLDAQPASAELGWGGMRLSGLLAAIADRHAGRAALKDQPGRSEWSGRARIDWTYPLAYEAIERLSDFFVRMKLPPKSPVGICLPNGSEACLALLAAEHAGLIPCLLPVAWTEDELGAAIEAAGIAAIVTQAIVGDERPAELFCRLASRYYGLRFIAAFGPMAPDGVTDLDDIVLSTEKKGDAGLAPPQPAGETGIVTFWRQGGTLQPLFRPCQSVVAAAVTFLVSARIRAGERILSLLAPDDHCGLTTGLIASLLSGATLECHGLFNSRSFLEALDEPGSTHLVVPAWMEASLAKASLPDSVASVILIHEAPIRFKAKSPLTTATVDVLSFGELAVIAAPRTGAGQFSLSLDEDPSQGRAAARQLIRVRRDADGTIEFSGPAVEVHPFARGAVKTAEPKAEWRRSGFKAETFAGILIGVTGDT
jgi:hypothetical protein